MTNDERRSSYLAKLRDPRWQKLRLEIFQRDDFACQSCYDTESTLHVHHRWYGKGEPWEVDSSALVTLCENCHEDETNSRRAVESSLLEQLRLCGFMSGDITYIALGFQEMAKRGIRDPQAAGIISSVIGWALADGDVLSELEQQYFDSLRANREEGGE